MTASFVLRLRRAALAALLSLASLTLAACALPVNRAPVQQTYRLTALRSAPRRYRKPR
jgi:hypothetical protein